MERLRLAGLVLVSLVVLVLVGSLVAGLGGAGGSGAGGGDPAATGAPAPERVRVEVLNAAGIPGLARAATDRLRDRGFDVVGYGNASGFGPDTSWVFDRTGRAEPAGRVAGALGIERVRTAVDTSLYVDVSVILGRDWAEAPAAPEPAADSAGR